MTEIHLGFRAYDVHELLCHGIAEAAGYYADAKLTVKLLDTTFLPEEALPEKTFHAACGAALASFLSGHKRKVVFIACDRPMFWLYGRQGIASVEQLAQARVATFPEAAPPAKFLDRILAAADVAPGLIPCRDDAARLAMLTSGSVDAALLGSRYMPAQVLSRGCKQLVSVGESLRLPSTGLAISQYLFESEPQLVASMVDIYQQAMKHVFDDDQELLRKVLMETFEMPEQGLDQAVQVIRDCYNPFGYSCDNLLQSAVDNMAAGMGLSARVAGDLYEFKYIKSYN
jgi:hypothetical protein